VRTRQPLIDVPGDMPVRGERTESRFAELQAKHQETLKELAGLRAPNKPSEAMHEQPRAVQGDVREPNRSSPGRRTRHG
jgi:hypothetical protein